MGKKNSRVSTESNEALTVSPFAGLNLGDLPPGPAEPVSVDLPDDKNSGPARLGRLVLRREKSGRGGKVVTVIDEFPEIFSEKELMGFLKHARRSCGCGGTMKGRSLELQGEQIEAARNFFTKEGFRVVGS
ncbi:MAG: translation initiation factor [Chthoniobacterales bacterium]